MYAQHNDQAMNVRLVYPRSSNTERRPCNIIELLRYWSIHCEPSFTPFVALHNLCDGVTDSDARLLGLFLGETRSYTKFDGRRRLPSSISRVGSQGKRVGFQSSDEDAIGKTLL